MLCKILIYSFAYFLFLLNPEKFTCIIYGSVVNWSLISVFTSYILCSWTGVGIVYDTNYLNPVLRN